MPNINLGDLFTLKNHAFQENYIEIFIGADAIFTPPIMVACEILNSGSSYNGDDGTKEVNQVRGLFFSYKTHKYEKHWFKIDEVKVLGTTTDPSGKQITIENISLQDLKSQFRNKQVILKSVDFELGKNKFSQERRNFENLLLKRNPYMDFVPPVMTVIDLRAHELVKDNYYKNTGNIKRSHSKLELKCKYYNPLSTTFSEEWLPVDCVIDITSNFDLNDVLPCMDKHFLYPLDKPIQFEDSNMKQIGTVIRLKEILFYHYKYVIVAEDLWTSQIIKIDVQKAINLKLIELDSFLEKRIPNNSIRYPLSEAEFETDNLYEISYLSDKGVSTTRLIYATGKYLIGTRENGDYLIVANCFLRNGHVRNFKVSNIKSSRKVLENMKATFIQPNMLP